MRFSFCLASIFLKVFYSDGRYIVLSYSFVWSFLVFLLLLFNDFNGYIFIYIFFCKDFRRHLPWMELTRGLSEVIFMMNSLTGLSLLTLPYGFAQAGLILGAAWTSGFVPMFLYQGFQLGVLFGGF